LYVGSIFNRRHVPDLLRGFGLVAGRYPRAALTLIGSDRTFPPENIAACVQRSPVRDRIDWRPYVSDAALGKLYAGARAFAFLSEYEGLGMTPLEALAAGVPPVVLDTPVARESCGHAAVYVSTPASESIAAALEQALYDRDTRTRILAAAPAVLARYSWPRAARDTLAALERACNRL
jgi:alpha-1,3-rhamnosyl/mannosyltransferase